MPVGSDEDREIVFFDRLMRNAIHKLNLSKVAGVRDLFALAHEGDGDFAFFDYEVQKLVDPVVHGYCQKILGSPA